MFMFEEKAVANRLAGCLPCIKKACLSLIWCWLQDSESSVLNTMTIMNWI